MVAPPRKAAFIRAKPLWFMLGLLDEALAALLACDAIQCLSGYRSDTVNRRVLYVARYHVAPTKGLYGFFGNTENCGYLSIARTVPAHLLYLLFLCCRHMCPNMKGALHTAAPTSFVHFYPSHSKPSAALVLGPALPSTTSLAFLWNLRTALSVREPNMPSIDPTEYPRFLRAVCNEATSVPCM